MIEKLINDLVEEICKKYKINKIDAEKIIRDEIKKYKIILSKWEVESDIKNIYRSSVYKNFAKKIKRKIYYQLRTYQKEGHTLAETHISTKERIENLKEFLFQINDVLQISEVIFDVGGGMFLTSFPFEEFKNIKRYIWLDKDQLSYKKIFKYIRDNNLHNVYLFNEKIGQRDWANYLPSYKEKFDLVLMMKLIPVVKRQESHLLVNLARIPSNYILVTGNKESMVKKSSIQKREEQIITSFISMTGKSIIKKIEIKNEFGYLIK